MPAVSIATVVNSATPTEFTPAGDFAVAVAAGQIEVEAQLGGVWYGVSSVDDTFGVQVVLQPGTVTIIKRLSDGVLYRMTPIADAITNRATATAYSI